MQMEAIYFNWRYLKVVLFLAFNCYRPCRYVSSRFLPVLWNYVVKDLSFVYLLNVIIRVKCTILSIFVNSEVFFKQYMLLFSSSIYFLIYALQFTLFIISK